MFLVCLPRDVFVTTKYLLSKPLALITQRAASELLLWYFPKKSKTKFVQKSGLFKGDPDAGVFFAQLMNLFDSAFSKNYILQKCSS